MPTHPFISRWHDSGAAERANYQLFLSEFCDFLDVPRPNPSVAINRDNEYVFERPVTFRYPNGLATTGFIDLYKRNAFVLEAKQGSSAQAANTLFEVPRRRGAGQRGTAGWDQAMLRARQQAEDYAKALPVEDGWPPFLIVTDVGYSFEMYADFSGIGKAYVPFPDSLNHRVFLEELETQLTRDRFRAYLARSAFARSKPGRRPRYKQRRAAACQFGPRSGTYFFRRAGGVVPNALHFHFLRRRYSSSSAGQLHHSVEKHSRPSRKFSAFGGIPMADDELGRVLTHPARACAALQWRLV